MREGSNEPEDRDCHLRADDADGRKGQRPDKEGEEEDSLALEAVRDCKRSKSPDDESEVGNRDEHQRA